MFPAIGNRKTRKCGFKSLGNQVEALNKVLEYEDGFTKSHLLRRASFQPAKSSSSLLWFDGSRVFAGETARAGPPLQVAHGGGAYISQTIAHGSAEQRRLLEINRRLIKAMGLQSGATHAEYHKERR